ncbi:MAG: hypothetical protein U9N30_07585 [Campylobacterota bacterium]|nr:hypothetical protein [Campylobacterota bacterium]
MLVNEKFMSKKTQVFKVCLDQYLPNFKLNEVTNDFKIVGKLRYDTLDDVLGKYESDHFVSYDKSTDTVTFDFASLKSNEMENRLSYISKTIWS